MKEADGNCDVYYYWQAPWTLPGFRGTEFRKPEACQRMEVEARMSDDFVWSAGGLKVLGLHDYADTFCPTSTRSQSLGLRIENLSATAKRDLRDLIAAGHTIRIVVEPKPFEPGYYRSKKPRKPGLAQSTPRPAAWFYAPPWKSTTPFDPEGPSNWERVKVVPE